jgi:hypothetical protein
MFACGRRSGGGARGVLSSLLSSAYYLPMKVTVIFISSIIDPWKLY